MSDRIPGHGYRVKVNMTRPAHGYYVKTDTRAGGIGFAVYRQGGDCGELNIGKNVLGSSAVFSNRDEWPLGDILLECDTSSNPKPGSSVDVYIYNVDIFGMADEDEATVSADGHVYGRGQLLCSTLLDRGKKTKHVHLMRDVPIPRGKFILSIMPIGCTVKANAWLTLRLKSGSIV